MCQKNSLKRRLNWGIGFLVCCVLILSISPLVAQTPYNTAFLTDEQLENYTSMTETEIRAFLVQHNSYFQREIIDVDGVSFDPAAVIFSAAQSYKINPQVLLATLQKESSGVTRSTQPSDTNLRQLMGCGNSTAREQLVCAAERFRSYHDDLSQRGTTISGWRVGVAKQTQDNVSVTPATKAVAGQFTYTPYAGTQWDGDQSTVGGVYLFYKAWQQFGFGQSETVGTAPSTKSGASATVFLLDVSGSMGDTWQGGEKLASAKSAALDVVNMIEQESMVGETEHQVAIATFSSVARLDLGLTTDYATVRQVINAQDPYDRTDMGAGLQVANRALTSAPADMQKIIILLSDGLTNEGLSNEGILSGPVQQAAEAGTCIYTVGFGEHGDLDEALLRRISADSGCGEYHYASAPSALANVYVRLRHQSLGTILEEFEGQIAQGETVDVGSVEVPQDKGELYITLQWPGSDMDLMATDPLGNAITENYPGASFAKYDRLIYLIIEDPFPGPWILKAQGIDVPEGLMTYHAIASVRGEGKSQPTASSNQSTWIILGVGFGVLLVFAFVVISSRSPVPSGVSSVQNQAKLRRGQLVIGRHPQCEMVLNDSHVSARHAIIQRTPQGYMLTDQATVNGTYVNGQRVQQLLLRGGEQIHIGDSLLQFYPDGRVVVIRRGVKPPTVS